MCREPDGVHAECGVWPNQRSSLLKVAGRISVDLGAVKQMVLTVQVMSDDQIAEEMRTVTRHTT
jgi:hypothetical protein